MAHLHPYSKDYMDSFGARVVAESGILSDKFHLGKLILQGFKDAPDFVLQIDGGTGELDTFQSALERSVRCSTCFRNLGLKHQNVVLIIARNHIHASIPQYAGLFLGLALAPQDANIFKDDLVDLLALLTPKIIFCEEEFLESLKETVAISENRTQIVSFGTNGDGLENFLEEYGTEVNMNDFRCENFDPKNTISYLLATSGTTGKPKIAELTHANFVHGAINTWIFQERFPTPTRMTLMYAPIIWFSTVMRVITSPILRFTRLHTSKERTWEHCCELIQRYKPTYTILTAVFITTMMRSAKPDQLDLSCFEVIILGGCHAPRELFAEIKEKYPAIKVVTALGMSESCGPFNWTLGKIPEDISVTPVKHVEMQLFDPTTLQVITKPNVIGEVWVRGPNVFQGYYKNPEVTVETLTQDGWLRTGDAMYMTETGSYIYVERIKMIMKYGPHHIYPAEIESVLMRHPGILNVAVTAYYDGKNWGDQVVACVVLKQGWQVTAQEIKDFVKDNLEDYKTLRGGVVFLKELPLTPNAKINRKKLNELVKSAKRE